MVSRRYFFPVLTIILFFCLSGIAVSQNVEVCSGKAGAKGEFKIVNDLDFDIEVKSVLPDCSERTGITVGAGRYLEVSAYSNQVFRVYENLTERVLTNIQFKSGQAEYSVTGFKKSETDPTAKLCSREGPRRVFFVRNATGTPIDIRFVKPDCTEQKGPEIAPGKQNGGGTFVNNVFRAYDKTTGTLISQFVIRPGHRNYVVGGERDKNPAQSFLKTVNLFRSYSKIGPLALDEKLNSACLWFAEFMSTQDKRHAGHLVTDFTKDGTFKKMNTHQQRLISFGWKNRSAADTVETTAMVRVEDEELIGAYLAMEWSSSTTHDKPFYDLYRTKYKKVGFAAVASPTDPKLYYGCAVFAND